MSEADPIFAAIEAWRRVNAEYMTWEGPDDILGELGDRHSEAVDLVLRMRPTTPAGLVALITFTRERAEWYKANAIDFNEDCCTLITTIEEAALSMIGAVG